MMENHRFPTLPQLGLAVFASPQLSPILAGYIKKKLFLLDNTPSIRGSHPERLFVVIFLRFLLILISSLFLLSFVHCTNVDDPSASEKPPIEDEEDTADFIFTPPNREVNVIEGMQVDYTVQLSSEPTGDVTLNINLATGLSGNVASLTFTTSNWNTAQTVTITADDNNYMGDYTAQVNHGVSSADSKYSSIAPDHVTVNITDDDGGAGNIVISTNMLAFNDTDGATGDTYTISLSHDPEPGKTVQVSLSSGNSTLQVSPMVVNFEGATGRSPQTITVTRAGGALGMIMADISVAISHTIATGVSYDPNMTTFANSGGTVSVTINSTAPVVDSDHDGLIDIDTAEKLNNMRYDLAGTSYKTSVTQTTGNSSGCPVINGSGSCHGYELTANIDLASLLDKNGNRVINKTTVIVAGKTHTVINTNIDTSWVPVGDNSTSSNASRFTGTFEGNNHTIANLWVNVASPPSSNNIYVGLFGVTGGTSVEIRNVRIISGSIHASSFSSYPPSPRSSSSGGLVGLVGDGSTMSITNSYFSGGGGVSSSSYSYYPPSPSSSESYAGGLVGLVGDGSTVSITNSYFSGGGGVSSFSYYSSSSSGGLVGSGGTVSITNSYFSGRGGISSSSSSAYSGGLVGSGGTVSITNSYFSGGGGVSSSSSSAAYSSSYSSYSGGLVGKGSAGSTVNIIKCYFSGGSGVSSSSSSSASYSSYSSSSKSYSGGLVGLMDTGSTMSIINSYFSDGGGVSSSSASSSSSSSYSGGLAGKGSTGSTMSITNSYFSGGGGVSSSSSSSSVYSSSSSYSGGLAGKGSTGSTMSIINSYFSGGGGVSSSSESASSSSSSSSSYSGGLAGKGSTGTITNSYFSGSSGVSSSATGIGVKKSYSGGLVGLVDTGSTMSITNSYWNKSASQSVDGGTTNQSPKRARGNSSTNPMGATGLTLAQLQAISMSTTSAPSPSGLPHSATDNTKAWNLGTASQLPVIKLCVNPTISNNVVTCASYGALLAGQR